MTTRVTKETLPGRLWWTRWPPLSERVLAEYPNGFLDDLYEPRRRQAVKSLRAPIVL